MSKTYRQQIIESVNGLIDARNVIFEQIVNLAMSNEYREISDVYEVGDVETFLLGHFENMKDTNVQRMVELCQKTEETLFTLMNLNAISENEVELEG